MTMRLPALCLSVLVALPAFSASADWRVYDQGAGMELALDHKSLWVEPDGLVHFVNQERFSRPVFAKTYQVWFSIRRTTGYADCRQARYALVSTDLYNDNNRHVWSTMYPQPRYAWKWQSITEESVAASMVNIVCASHALRKKPE